MAFKDFAHGLSGIHPSEFVEIAHKHITSFDLTDKRQFVYDFSQAITNGFLSEIIEDEKVEDHEKFITAVYSAELFLAAFHHCWDKAEAQSDMIESLNELIKK